MILTRRSHRHAHHGDHQAQGEHSTDRAGSVGVNVRGDTQQLPSTRKVQSGSWWTKYEDIEVFGDTLAGKKEDVLGIYFENVDGLSIDPSKYLSKNKKLFISIT